MGCDGGTIPRRDELVRTKKKPEQKDKSSELSFRWQHCSISQQPLRAPIVSCGYGRLYRKEVLIEGMLDRSTLPEIAQHIKNLKDVKNLNLTPNPAYKAAAEKGGVYIDMQMSPFICPVIGLEMNGKFRFVFLWGCGCVLSERALKEVKAKLCHKCQMPFTEQDVVIMNAVDDDLDLMVTRMEARQARAKAEKKEKSEAKASRRQVKSAASATVTSATVTSAEACSSSSSSSEEIPSTSKIASCPGEINEMKNEPKLTVKPTSKLLKRPASKPVEDPLFKKTKESYSIAEDPRATDVFKSLFTSHKSASEQTRAHWVTYNPFYN